MLLSCQLWMFYITFVSFLGLLITSVPSVSSCFSVFLTLFRSDFGTESKRNKIPEINFSRTEEDRGTWGPRQESHTGPTSPVAATRGAVASRLVASLAPPDLASSPIYSLKYRKKIRESTKTLFRRRKLPFPRDLIWRPFPVPCRRGLWSWRASTSTSSPLQWLVSSSLQTYGSVDSI